MTDEIEKENVKETLPNLTPRDASYQLYLEEWGAIYCGQGEYFEDFLKLKENEDLTEISEYLSSLEDKETQVLL